LKIFAIAANITQQHIRTTNSIDICNGCKNLNQHCVAISTDHTNAELYVEKHTNLIGYNKSQNKQVRSKAPLSN
jgi:predicted transglutaminase-like cysteine proteinase